MPGTASFKRLYRSVGAALHALELSTYMDATPTIDDARRVIGVIRDRVVAGDVFVQKLICQSEKNPHRPRFMDYSGELSDGDEIPDHYGPLGEVVIKKYSGASTFDTAIEADELQQILDWRENVNNVFGAIAHDAANSPLSGFFKQAGHRIRFTGYRLKIEIANIVVPGEADNPPTLYSPDAYEDVIFAHATSESLIEGDDMAELGYRRAYVSMCAPLILQGAVELPPFKQK